MVSDLAQVHEREYLIYGPYVKEQLMYKKNVYIYFNDYTKAFDRVKYLKMIECLSEIEIDDKDLQIITKLYREQSASVRTESGMTSEFKNKERSTTGLCTITKFIRSIH